MSAADKRGARNVAPARVRRTAARGQAATVEAQIRAFVANYAPGIARDLRAARRRLRALFPRGYELVYDNYNALAIGYASSERASDAIVSIAAYPNWVTLFFLYGKPLADPHGLLQGSGSRVRSIRLAPLARLDEAPVRALLARALAPYAAALRAAPALRTIVKSVSARQRPRRPAAAARKSIRHA